MTRPLQGRCQHSLVSSTRTGLSARLNLGAVGNVTSQLRRIFVVDALHFIDAERTNPAPAETAAATATATATWTPARAICAAFWTSTGRVSRATFWADRRWVTRGWATRYFWFGVCFAHYCLVTITDCYSSKGKSSGSTLPPGSTPISPPLSGSAPPAWRSRNSTWFATTSVLYFFCPSGPSQLLVVSRPSA